MPRGLLHSLDHVVIAVRDLAAAAEGYAALLGRPPSWRGVHPSGGTANALFRLENTYLELLAPEGDGELGRRVGDVLAERGEGLVALAFGTDDAEACARRLRAAGLEVGDPSRTSSGVDVSGRLIVLLTALQQCFWNAACIRKCQIGSISRAVANSRRSSSGTA